MYTVSPVETLKIIELFILDNNNIIIITTSEYTNAIH